MVLFYCKAFSKRLINPISILMLYMSQGLRWKFGTPLKVNQTIKNLPPHNRGGGMKMEPVLGEHIHQRSYKIIVQILNRYAKQIHNHNDDKNN